MDSLSGWVSENTRGFSYLQFIRKLCTDIEDDWDKVQSQLETIRQCILSRSNAYVNLTADEKLLSQAKGYIDGLMLDLPEREAVANSWGNVELFPKRNESLVIPTQVMVVVAVVRVLLLPFNCLLLSIIIRVVFRHSPLTYLFARIHRSITSPKEPTCTQPATFWTAALT